MTTTTLINEAAIADQSKTEPQAFATLYEYYFPRVYNYVLYRVQAVPLAADLTARTFELALKRIGQYDPQRGSFGGWLFTIARNVVRQHWRRSAIIRWLPLERATERPDTLPLPEEALATVERHQALLAAVSALPRRDQEVLALKYGASLTNRDIAAVTGLSASNVGVILHRSIGKLRILLEANHDLRD